MAKKNPAAARRYARLRKMFLKSNARIIEQQKEIDDIRNALRSLTLDLGRMILRVDTFKFDVISILHLYDRAAGNVRLDCGFTAADVKRLEEIRKRAQP